MSRLVLFFGVWLALAFAVGDGAIEVVAGEKRPLVLQAHVDNEPITPGTARYIKRAIHQADEQGAECLIVFLDTPGGLLDSTRSIVKEILKSRTCVVVYVAPSGSRAASAGTFITLAAHVAAMAPGTTIGAAHPVQVGGLPIQPPQEERSPERRVERSSEKETKPHRTVMEEKIVNDTVVWARALAELRGRNSDWAARAVSESLSVAASAAVEQRVVDFEAADLDELLRELDGREITLPHGPRILRTSDAELRDVPMWWGERVLAILSRPNIAFLLLIFGFYGVLFELYSPGWGVSGTLGAICLLLALFGLAVLPVNYLGMALIILALGLFVAEVFVTSFGTLTFAGFICLVLGGVMLVDSPLGFSRVSLGVVVPLAAATAAITVFWVGAIVRTHRRGIKTGDEGLLGTTAKARNTFKQREDRFVGMVFAHGEWWQAISEDPVVAEQTCLIKGRQDLTLAVEPSEVPSGET